MNENKRVYKPHSSIYFNVIILSPKYQWQNAKLA